MKRFKNPKLIIVMLTVMLALSVTTNVLGANGLVDITAQLNNNVRIMLNGKPFEPTDPQDGTKYVPIVYKGRIYLPIRPVAEAVGLEVLWDGPNNTAYLGSTAGEIAKDQLSWIRLTPEYAPGSDGIYRLKSRQPEFLNRAPGKTFEYGYAYEPEYSAGVSLFVNTEFEYDKFKATFWLDDDYLNEDGSYVNEPEIAFYDEFGSPIKVIKDVEWKQLVEVELDIKDVRELEVWVQGGLSIIGEPMLGK